MHPPSPVASAAPLVLQAQGAAGAGPAGGAAAERRAGERRRDAEADPGAFSDMVVQAQDRLDEARKPAALAGAAAHDHADEARAPRPEDALAAVSPLPGAAAPARALEPGAPSNSPTPNHQPSDHLPAEAAPAGNAVAGPEAAGDAAAAAGDDPPAAAAHLMHPADTTREGGRHTAAAAANPAIQLALQQAMREASGTDPMSARAKSTATRSPLDLSGERGSRLRRIGEADQSPGGRPALEAGRSGSASAVASDGATAPATGSADAAALIAEVASQPAGVLPATPNSGPGADQGVFALTMNQAAPSGMAATRADMLAVVSQASIEVPLDHADFGEAFARQSASLIVQGSSNAEIHLNPRDMGPIRIAIALDADAASLDISAAHADTRAAIEASLPALRQMLGDQGIRLANWRIDGEAGGDALAQSESQSSDQRPPDARQQEGADTGARDGLAGNAGESQAAPGGHGGLEGRGRRFGWQRSSVEAQGALPPGGSAGTRAGGASSRIDLYA